MSEQTYRMGLRWLGSSASFDLGDPETGRYMAVQIDADTFRRMGRPGWIDITVAPSAEPGPAVGESE